MTEQVELNRQIHTILNELTETMAQIGQALSVHLPAADLDRAVTTLTRVNHRLNTLEAFIDD